MEKIEVPYLHVSDDASFHEISGILNRMERYAIDKVSWPIHSYKPEVFFAIAHNGNCIFLKYFVSEKCIRAVYRETHDPVFRDSCVEFFISYDNNEGYYNLEFNCVGTCMFGFGKERISRKPVPEETVKKIRRRSIIETINAGNNATTIWELTIVIPREVFIYHSIPTFKNRHCRTNLYKCGDELPEPHFLAWNNIVSDFPDFHQPKFFGSLHFAGSDIFITDKLAK